MRYGLKAYLIWDIGQRKKQEDAFFSPIIEARHFDEVSREEAYYEGTPHTEDTLFILCDGMGGHERGEVASNLVCKVMGEFLTETERKGIPFDVELLQKTVEKAFVALDEVGKSNAVRKMGTTMTLLKIHHDTATIAHIGDSRVYHFRPSNEKGKARMLFCTEDHSLVNELLHNNMITHQQARFHPQRHVLTRSMMAGRDSYMRADVYETKDIMLGDVFFLCSDGITEKLSDGELCTLLTNPRFTDEQRVQLLLKYCKDNRDNHTAWIVRVMSMEKDDGTVIEYKDDGRYEDTGIFRKLMRLIGIKNF